MFNNINDNNLLNSQLSASNIINLNSIQTSLKKSGYTTNPCIDKTEISSDAMKLFQRDLDINKFTKILMDEKDDISYLEKMNELFKDGVLDPFNDDAIKSLVTNSKLLDDLDL